MPGNTSVTYGNSELSLAMNAQELTLNRMKDHPYRVVEDVMANAESKDGGERIIVRYSVDDHSKATRVQSGMETFNNYAQPTLLPGQQTWGIVVMPIYVSSIDEKKYGGSAGLIKLVEDRTETVQTTMNRQFQQVIFRGPAGAGANWAGVPGWEDFLSLNGADGAATGLMEAAASGTNTIHGISKATYPAASHEQFHNFYRSLGGTAGTTGLNGLYASTIDSEIKEGDPLPSQAFWYWSRLFMEFMKRALRAEEHYVSEGNMDDGKRRTMTYGGLKVRATAELPNSGTNTTGNPWSAVKVNWKEGIRFTYMDGWNFMNDPFVNLPGTVGGRYALRKLWGQFVGLKVGRCGLLANGEAF